MRGGCHGHTKPGLRQSTDDEAMIDKATNVEQEVTRLGTLEVVSDEIELRKLGLIGEHKDKYEDQEDKYELSRGI